MNLPMHKCGLYLEHNRYKDVYSTLEQGITEADEMGSWIPGEREKSLKTGDIWTLQWYPDTPVGFCHLTASMLEKLLEAANE